MDRAGDEVTAPEQGIAEIKADISETQGELQRTIAAIEERLSPSHLAEQARDTVREATIGKVKDMTQRAGDSAARLAEQTRNAVPTWVRQNPIPLALIGVGAVWLLARGDSSHSGRSAGWNQNRWNDESDEYGSTFHDRDSTSRGSMGVSGGGEGLRRTAADAQHQLARTMNQNPLALGVAALVAGALVGAMIPTTKTENQYLGEARDSVVDKARDMAEHTAERVVGAADEALSLDPNSPSA